MRFENMPICSFDRCTNKNNRNIAKLVDPVITKDKQKRQWMQVFEYQDLVIIME